MPWQPVETTDDPLPPPPLIGRPVDKPRPAPERNHRVHEVKSWPTYFEPVARGVKRWELRKNDRGYEVGDLIHLREWDPEAKSYTGRSLYLRIDAVSPIGDFVKRPQHMVVLDVRRVTLDAVELSNEYQP